MLIESKLSRKINTKLLRKIFLLFILFLSVVNMTSHAQNKKYIVVLDAGHGDHDPGNVGNGYREKNIVLKVVLEIGKQLKKNKDIKVVYTRKTDVFIDLWKRGDIANKAKADLFVSVHCNSHSSNAYGTESFVLGLGANNKNFKVAQEFVQKENSVIKFEKNYKERYKNFNNSAESKIGLSLVQEENLDKSLALASSFQKGFKNKLKRKSRGVKQQRFVVLHQTYMPSVLVELGFLTNKSEGRYLNSKRGQKQMAAVITSSINNYINQLKLNTVSVNGDEILADIDTPVIEDDVEESSVVFKVQIASSKKRIATKSYNFRGLRNVERVKVGRYYKYYYGNTSNYSEAKSSFRKTKKKGYKSAFIAAFKDGKKVSISEALK